MSSWQERINQRARELEAEQQRKRIEAEEAAKLAAEQKAARIANLLGLIDRLGVVQTLEEIRSTVWREGKITSWITTLTREVVLAFGYQKPDIGYEKVYEKKIGFYEKPVYHSNVSMQGGSVGWTSSETRFGIYQKHVGNKALLRWQKRVESLSVRVEHILQTRVNSEIVKLVISNNSFPDGKTTTSRLVVDLEHPYEAEAPARAFFDEQLLTINTNMKLERRLPWQIKEDLPKKVAKVQQEISQHNRNRYR